MFSSICSTTDYGIEQTPNQTRLGIYVVIVHYYKEMHWMTADKIQECLQRDNDFILTNFDTVMSILADFKVKQDYARYV